MAPIVTDSSPEKTRLIISSKSSKLPKLKLDRLVRPGNGLNQIIQQGV